MVTLARMLPVMTHWLSASAARRLWLLVAAGLLLGASSAQAWGPHPAITQAALDTLGTNHPLVLRLGEHVWRLTNHAWMADYKGVPYRDSDQQFYADDYLLFPKVPKHYDHICPEVKLAYRPYLLRALQALETEDRANASRWIGSLLHFVEDTGSPPHAAQIRGGIHSNMENWVDATQIHIEGYRPVLLGTNVEHAVAGLRRRMDGLIEFSRERAARSRLFVELGNRTATMPIVLESALETSRVTADLLHTLGELARRVPPTNHAGLTGRISSVTPVGMEPFPARLVLLGTSFSTLADPAGAYEFQHLPAGEFQLMILRPGSAQTMVPVSLKARQTNRLDLTLQAGSLLRNGDFSLRWVQGSAPDCWRAGAGQWEGEIVPLLFGQRYRLQAEFVPGASGDVFVRWTRHLPHELPKLLQRLVPLPRIESKALTIDQPLLEFTGSESMALVQVTVRGTNDPSRICKELRLVPVSE